MTDATPSSEEGLSPEIKARMEEGRERMEEVGEELELEQAGHQAFGEDMPGDVPGEGLEGTTGKEDREAAARVAAEQPHE